ncbi:MAG TPA: DNA-formamidopyrimidine glycosylase family protein [Flavobacteriales bacterium]|nr:DNA-formamidopyrimidine glycosylase family protein [Flavobacteriales bacterium]
MAYLLIAFSKIKKMPEGPSIVILKEAVSQFTGKKVKKASGNSKQLAFKKITGQKITAFKSWGKHFLICFPTFSVRIHFLLFGSYRINEKKESSPRLSLQFSKGEINFYACSVKELDQDLDQVYDWSADVLNENWDKKKALEKLKKQPLTLVCDALLDQTIFAGVGNIIKNEVLYRIKVHPLSEIGKLPPKKLKLLVKEAEKYSFDFLKWKKEFTLKKHWLAHTKKKCARDKNPILKMYAGKTNRRTFYCEYCQVLYN